MSKNPKTLRNLQPQMPELQLIKRLIFPRALLHSLNINILSYFKILFLLLMVVPFSSVKWKD